MKISFIEKDPYYDNSLFTGDCYMYPTYMVKDGKEYFIFNRREPQAPYENKQDEENKRFLISTDGRYLKFHGYESDPLKMLKIATERGHHFVLGNLWSGDFGKEGYMDFHGNFQEVSAAFHYRIYDAELIKKIKEATSSIIEEM